MIALIFCILVLVNSAHNKPWDSNEIESNEINNRPDVTIGNCAVIINNGVYFNNCTKEPSVRLINSG